MDSYAKLIRALKGQSRIDAFCEAVNILGLTGNKIAEFAYKCKFMLSTEISERSEHA